MAGVHRPACASFFELMDAFLLVYRRQRLLQQVLHCQQMHRWSHHDGPNRAIRQPFRRRRRRLHENRQLRKLTSIRTLPECANNISCSAAPTTNAAREIVLWLNAAAARAETSRPLRIRLIPAAALSIDSASRLRSKSISPATLPRVKVNRNKRFAAKNVNKWVSFSIVFFSPKASWAGILHAQLWLRVLNQFYYSTQFHVDSVTSLRNHR